jgi:leucyl-tRNA synthetase
MSNFQAIEKKWQQRWEKEKAFEAKEGSKKKMYILEMFPYPSGSGLHMGHAFNYTVGDIYTRFKRMQGYNVLYPMGYDSFGLPAENAAIKEKTHPKPYTEKAIKNFIAQQKALGLSYDWNRMFKTSDPEYYKWNQFFFLQFLKKGLAYRKNASVNWCPKCDTVLANEQVHQGTCWRHSDTDVEIRQLEQWFIKTTAYAEELLKDIDKLEWPERIKIMQRNWIGKSEGTEVDFPLDGTKKKLPIFTTRIDTLFSVTFLVIAPEHPLVQELIKDNPKKKGVEQFINKVVIGEKFSRTDEGKQKEGVFTGKYAINPATKEKIPIWIANFVLMDYGTGIVMADAHDERDYDFAQKYKIPLRIVLKPKDGKERERPIEEFGILCNSGQFNGLTSEKAIPEIQKWLISQKAGRKITQYKLRDWLVSRQRYWGTPIPIIYCKECGIVPVPEKDLPVLLPERVTFGKGNPLESSKEFINVKCPACKKPARRETDTMDTFMDSSWYFLRYTDNHNNKQPFDKKKASYWMPVDQYIGGAEHATMHLIYARFFTKVLRDLGYVSIDEPFPKLFTQGMLHKDGFVMSKSRGNVVLPEEVSKQVGIDTARFFLVSIASADKDREWSEEGIAGSARFVNKIMEYVQSSKPSKSSPRTLHHINKAIKDITENIERFNYNLAAINIRDLMNKVEPQISKQELEIIIKLLAPFCPHIAEELWEKTGHKEMVCYASWPTADIKKIDMNIEKQDTYTTTAINDILNISKLVKEKQGKEPTKVYLYVLPQEAEIYLIDEIKKSVNKEVTIYKVNDKNKHDPQNKSSKAKPGKPAIYME